MTALTRRPSTVRWLSAGALCGLFSLFGGQACSKESRADQAQGSAASVASGADRSQGASASAKSAPARVQEQHFDVTMTARGPFKIGVLAEAEIVLLALGAYKVNQEYPIKFKLADNAGMDHPAPVVKRDRVKLESKRAIMTVPFVPRVSGNQSVAGALAFSVCTEQKCVMEKRSLGVPVRVE